MPARSTTPVPEPAAAAREAGLRHVNDGRPGIRRRRAGKSFSFALADGSPIRDADELTRIRSLAIPPAWTDVWICPHGNGHIQATGRDARGRKQYRYHPRWRQARDQSKYHRTIAFALALPAIRARLERDLRRRGLPREKVLAAVVRLLETTLIRVGNEEYARQNRSYGLTTLQDRHAKINGSSVKFRFKGKSGREHEVELTDRRLARIVRDCRDLPGQDLFQYVDAEGQVCDIGSADVNEYLRQISGDDFTAKDFRTWAGTVLAAMALRELNHARSKTAANRNILRAVEAVAGKLGNTRTVCRKCYVHPAVIDSYLDGTLVEQLRHRARRATAAGLSRDEQAVLRLLQRRLDVGRRSAA